MFSPSKNDLNSIAFKKNIIPLDNTILSIGDENNRWNEIFGFKIDSMINISKKVVARAELYFGRKSMGFQHNFNLRFYN